MSIFNKFLFGRRGNAKIAKTNIGRVKEAVSDANSLTNQLSNFAADWKKFKDAGMDLPDMTKKQKKELKKLNKVKKIKKPNWIRRAIIKYPRIAKGLAIAAVVTTTALLSIPTFGGAAAIFGGIAAAATGAIAATGAMTVAGAATLGTVVAGATMGAAGVAIAGVTLPTLMANGKKHTADARIRNFNKKFPELTNLYDLYQPTFDNAKSQLSGVVKAREEQDKNLFKSASQEEAGAAVIPSDIERKKPEQEAGAVSTSVEKPKAEQVEPRALEQGLRDL